MYKTKGNGIVVTTKLSSFFGTIVRNCFVAECSDFDEAKAYIKKDMNELGHDVEFLPYNGLHSLTNVYKR